MPEQYPIIKIAEIISNNDADVMKDINICVSNTDTYFKDHAGDYDERGITAKDIEKGEVAKDEIIWLTKLFRKGKFSPFYLSPECKNILFTTKYFHRK